MQNQATNERTRTFQWRQRTGCSREGVESGDLPILRRARGGSCRLRRRRLRKRRQCRLLRFGGQCLCAEATKGSRAEQRASVLVVRWKWRKGTNLSLDLTAPTTSVAGGRNS